MKKHFSCMINDVKDIKSNKREPIPSLQEYMKDTISKIVNLKRDGKRDAIVQVDNREYLSSNIVAYVMKCLAFGNPTLISPSKGTLFIFKLKGPEENLRRIRADLADINSKKDGEISQIKRTVKKVFEYGCKLQFHSADFHKLERSLKVTDTGMINIIADMLVLYYGFGYTRVDCLLDKVSKDNQIFFEKPSLYIKKFSNMLIIHTIGEHPGSRFYHENIDQQEQEKSDSSDKPKTVGLITINDDFNIFVYHSKDRKYLEEYLIRNTKFDTPSSKSIPFGFIYEVDGELYIDLCLQVRFIKPRKLKKKKSEEIQEIQRSYSPDSIFPYNKYS